MHAPYRPTNPHRDPRNGMFIVPIRIDEETYAEIDRVARGNNCSFTEQARIFLDVGIETMEMEKRDAA